VVSPARTSHRGRIDKRDAILDAAFQVFTEQGYAHASIDAIAAVAGVAKPTIYNHFGDKETLFRTVMTDSSSTSAVKIVNAVNSIAIAGGDLRTELTQLALALIDCQVSDRGWALQRLLYAEAARMPDLYDEVVSRGGPPVMNALTGRFALLAHAGGLELDDPALAANQFMALITGNLPALSALGTRPVAPAQLEADVRAGVDTFLRAFGPRPATAGRTAARGARGARS
jgi:TetR/AcrR family transcriptional repressor of mexJK operon